MKATGEAARSLASANVFPAGIPGADRDWFDSRRRPFRVCIAAKNVPAFKHDITVENDQHEWELSNVLHLARAHRWRGRRGGGQSLSRGMGNGRRKSQPGLCLRQEFAALTETGSSLDGAMSASASAASTPSLGPTSARRAWCRSCAARISANRSRSLPKNG
jgi:hypothetical protein